MEISDFPTCVKELSCAWLTRILKESGFHDDVTVTFFSIGPVGDPGQTSEVVRIQLEYDGKGSLGPKTLIGKFPAEFEQARELARSMDSYIKEVMFFKEVADTARGLTPRCYAARINRETNAFVLILEDIAHLRMGEMFDSEPDDSRLMLRKLAPFHARWWDHPDIETLDWLAQPGKPSFAAWMNNLKAVFIAVLPMIKGEYERYMSANTWAVLEKSLSVWDEMFAFTPGPFTLCHGDFHYLQCFFPTPAEDRFAVIDWQVLCVNSAAMDIARPLLLLDPESRRLNEHSIVEEYYELLVKNGVKNYSLDDLWEDIRLNAFWAVYINILAILQTDNEIFKAYAAERGHDPYEALLSWPGKGIDDWEADKAIDRYLERARAANNNK